MKSFLKILCGLLVVGYALTTEATPPAIGNITITNAAFAPGGAQIITSVNPNGNATTWQINYGLTTNYGSSTVLTNVGSGSSYVTVSNLLPFLIPNTVYHLSIYASSGAFGSTNTPDSSFTNYTIGMVSYYAMFNFLLSNYLSSAQFSPPSNGFPLSLNSFLGISNINNSQFAVSTDGTLSIAGGAPITNAILLGVYFFGSDFTVGNQLSAVVGDYITNLVPAVNGTNLIPIYTNTVSSNNLFKLNCYQVITSAGSAGTASVFALWQDESGRHLNPVLSLMSLSGSNAQSGMITLHCATNTVISLVSSNASSEFEVMLIFFMILFR